MTNRSTPLRLLQAGLIAFCLFSADLSAADNWKYSNETNRMTDGKVKTAEIRSSNSLRLSFPYAGHNPGSIYVRGSPTPDVQVSVERGQILCTSYQGCVVSVRFDSDQVVNFLAQGSSDQDPTVFFLGNAPRFVELAGKAKRIMIQFEMYQSGQQTLVFNTSKPLALTAPTKSMLAPVE